MLNYLLGMRKNMGTEIVNGLEEEFLKALHILNENQYGKKDKINALGTLDRLSAEGHIRSTILLGMIYEDGTLVEKDLEKAKDYYEKSVFLGAVNGEYRLGLLLLQDNKFRNEEEGFKHIEASAKKGLKEALFSFGEFYEKGIVVQKDLRKAKFYYLEAGKRGYGLAYYELSLLAHDEGNSDAEKEYIDLAKANGYDISSKKQNFLKA